MNDIAIISPDYKDIGMIGPTDKITLYCKIKAANNISNANGTYFLDFGVPGEGNMCIFDSYYKGCGNSAAVKEDSAGPALPISSFVLHALERSSCSLGDDSSFRSRFRVEKCSLCLFFKPKTQITPCRRMEAEMKSKRSD